MEDLISLETAKLAKEKGFNWECQNYFMPRGMKKEYETMKSILPYNHTEQDIRYINRPTQSLLQKWLREVHNIEVFLTPTHLSYIDNKSYKVECEYFNGVRVHCFKHDTFKNYEQALEKGLQEALKLI